MDHLENNSCAQVAIQQSIEKIIDVTRAQYGIAEKKRQPKSQAESFRIKGWKQ